MPAATSFTFEHSHLFGEKDYVEIMALPFAKGRSLIIRGTMILILAVACLFWSYTLLLGIVALAFCALLLWMPHTLPQTAARRFRDSKLLGHTLVYGVNEREMWVRGPGYSATAEWSYLRSGSIRGQWLVLWCEDFPPICLPLSELSAAGLRSRVIAMARAHATIL